MTTELNRKRIIVWSIVLLLIPQVVGFLFGVTNPLWQDRMDSSTALWARRVVIAVALFGAYVAFAWTTTRRRFASVLAVFTISEVVGVSLHLGAGGSAISASAWLALSAVAAATGLMAGQLASGRGQPRIDSTK